MARTNECLADRISRIKSKAMTSGVVLLAFNNSQIDYQRLAAWSADRIHRWLKLPVTLITDQMPKYGNFDSVVETTVRPSTTRWFPDYQQTMPWHNANRVDVYHLTPYHKTLVLDVDYVVASQQLRCLFDSGQEFLSHGWAVDAVNSDNYQKNNFFGRYRMPMSWATVLYFEKSMVSEQIFELMNRIKNNWTHYRYLYGIADPTYRNDFALSVAQHVVFGFRARSPGIPWNLINVTPDCGIQQIDHDVFKVEFEQKNKFKWLDIINQDFHAMNKKTLGDIVAKNPS